ncbi:MAG TPA: sialate O-acetylesterase, partial [Planctomycetota bacterium]|nr:sialate O-acetylesterase [Planctomycetota bacterium]
EVAGLDGRFVTAHASIDGDTVLLSADGVGEPATVRFAWAAAAEPNLKNGAGLPAWPFLASW